MHRIWEVIKQFCVNHSQHSTLEKIFLILAIIGATVVFIEGIIFIYRVGKNIKRINKEINQSKHKSDKTILSLIKKKKNISY